jgi:hypothetical protein
VGGREEEGNFNAEDAESAEVAEKKRKSTAPSKLRVNRNRPEKGAGLGRRWLCHMDWGKWIRMRS